MTDTAVEPRPAERTEARRAVLLVAGLGGWTVFEWATRIRNAAVDSSLDAGEKALAVGSAAGFTALGAVALAYAWRGRRAGLSDGAPRFVGAFAGITTAWWAVRTVLVWAHEHDTPFKVVHTVLAVISITLAVVAYRATSRASVRHRQPPPALRNSSTLHSTTS